MILKPTSYAVRAAASACALVAGFSTMFSLTGMAQNQPIETQPVQVQTFETKPADAKPVETQPSEIKPIVVRPSEEGAAQTGENGQSTTQNQNKTAPQGASEPLNKTSPNQAQDQASGQKKDDQKTDDPKADDAKAGETKTGEDQKPEEQSKPQPKADSLGTPYENWQTSLNKDHPLTGRIWSTQEGAFIAPEDLVSRVAYRDYILLGETHDNPDHHRLQAWIILKILKFDRKPSIVMEMIEQSQADKLASFFSAPGKPNAASLGEVLKWTERGWPDWKIYQPIADVAFDADLPIVPGNANRDDIKAVAKNGLVHIAQDKRSRLGLDALMLAPLSNSLKEQLSASHCYMMSNAELIPMAMAQRFQDAVMADTLIQAGQKKGAVLIAGSGHVRSDRGIPYYILQREPEKRIASVMIIEVESDKMNAADYVPRDPGAQAATDYIWFTPRQERPDPCEELRKHLKK